MARLGDVFKLQITGEWGNECAKDEAGTKVLRTTNFTSEGIINYSDVVVRSIREDKIEKKKLYYGDIILEKSGGTEKTPVGRVVFCDESIQNDTYLCNNFTQVMRVNQMMAVPKYVFYFMWNLHYSGKTDLLQNKTTGIRNLQLKSYLKENFPLPLLNEQYKIVAVLDKVSDLILKRCNQLDKLNELVRSRFVEMFGDPKINEKGWKTGIISDYYDVKGGKRIPKGMGYADRVTKHPYLRATDMKNGTIIEEDIHYIDEDVFQHIKRYTVKGGDVYLTNVGVNLGMAGVIPNKFDGANLTENAVKLVPKTEKVMEGIFLAHYINSSGIQDYINERKMAVGVPKLAIFRIETMPLLLPPKGLQDEFASFVHQADKSKIAIRKNLEKLVTLKKSLLQEYFG